MNTTKYIYTYLYCPIVLTMFELFKSYKRNKTFCFIIAWMSFSPQYTAPSQKYSRKQDGGRQRV